MGAKIRARRSLAPPGSWVGGTSKIWTRIGAMNQIGTPLPALSPQGGERVAAGRERGGSWVASTISESRGTMNQRRTGARTALSASASDLIRADMAVPAPIAGSWKASFRFCARIGTMNRCASQRRGPDRGSATRSLLGSWRASSLGPLRTLPACFQPSDYLLVCASWRHEQQNSRHRADLQ